MKVRAIAIYLPQFHPIEENNIWWGKGFTEWTNVTKAKPLFRGHYQPHLPTELGFYDLRLSEYREQQAKLANENNIHGFCYYHYWFNGKRILEKPFEEVFNSKTPNFPFMLCWANENWTRTWDGSNNEILLKQDYNEEDHRQHIRSLIDYFKDDRYIKINNKPVFAIYNSEQIPDISKAIHTFRDEAKRYNIDLYICRFENLKEYGDKYLKKSNFDAAINFEPFSPNFYKYKNYIRKNIKKRFLYETKKMILSILFLKKQKELLKNSYDYKDYVNFVLKLKHPNYKVFPCVTPSWDNTPRKKQNFFIFKNSSPKMYAKWLKNIIEKFIPYSKEENLIFINAWNEWAEGNHLEPCIKWDDAYLKETKKILENNE